MGVSSLGRGEGGSFISRNVHTHTHITRSDYLEKLGSGWGFDSMFCRDQETRKRIGKSKGPYTPGRISARVIRQRFSTRLLCLSCASDFR